MPVGAVVLPQAHHGFGPLQQAFIAVGGEFFGLGIAFVGDVPIAQERVEHGQFLPQQGVARVALDGFFEQVDGFFVLVEAIEVFGQDDGGLRIPRVAAEGVIEV
jgi:hypothetical protein